MAAWVAVDRAMDEVIGHCALVPVDAERSSSPIWERAARLPPGAVSLLFVAPALEVVADQG
jgi:hypothetical protein